LMRSLLYWLAHLLLFIKLYKRLRANSSFYMFSGTNYCKYPCVCVFIQNNSMLKIF
jgi:hypothetical protein